ncbi:Bax inhibitor-1/YccA family protein [Deltaproteobacteria bacterium OttesenSCG-928-K17]|nr:Bax inhibitor-1/YccA family protein [Deltaproteobacteria bacterium OttesenSCG-928-K17]
MQDFTNYSPNTQNSGALAQDAIRSEAAFFQKTYAWMFAALAVTTGVAFVLSSSNAWLNFLRQGGFAYWAVALLPLGLAWYVGSKVESLAPSAIAGFLLAIGASFGLTLSVVFVIYPTAALVKAFICTAGIYGAMAVYGMVTKRSLQAMGSFLFMGLVGLIIASIVNLFIKSGPMDFVICVIGVLLFSALTAYDHQKLRVMHFSAVSVGADNDTLARYALMGSLTLYLDFLNLFLFLLRIIGRADD